MSKELSAFEDVVIDGMPGFEPDIVFANGNKDQNGSVTVSAEDILSGKVDKGAGGAGGKKAGNGKDDDDDNLEDKLDEFIDKELGATDDDDDNPDDDNDDDDLDDDDDQDDKGTKGKAKSNDKTDPDGKPNPFKAYYELMVNAGLWEEDDDFDGSEDKFLEIQEKNNEQHIQEGVNAFIEKAFVKNPEGAELGKSLLQHLAKGGSVSTFVIGAKAEEFDEDQLDDDDAAIAENAASTMLKEYYTLIGMKPEKIVANIAKMKTKGMLVDTAKDLVDTYKDLATETRENEQRQAAAAQKANEKKSRLYTQNVLNLLEQNDEVRGVALGSPKDKQKLKSYMFAPSVELEDGRKIPQLHYDLLEVKSDPEWNLFLARSVQEFKSFKAGKPGKTDNKNGGGKGSKPALKGVVQNLLRNSSSKAADGSASASSKEKPGIDLKSAWNV